MVKLTQRDPESDGVINPILVLNSERRFLICSVVETCKLKNAVGK